MNYDIAIWEEIRFLVKGMADTLAQNIEIQISNDLSLREFHGRYPVPWQLREVMQQRADSWIQRLYDPCCDVYKRSGKELSPEFDRAVWAYHVEPFIMSEVEANRYGYRASILLELLLCAVGSSPEKRNQLKVGQKDCCLDVRTKTYETWYDKLHHLPPRINQAIAAMSRYRAMEARAARIAAGLPPEPCSPPATVPPAETQLSKPPHTALALGSPPESAAPISEDVQASSPVLEPVGQAGHDDTPKWQALEIIFLSDHRVQIRKDGKNAESLNYGDLGLTDGRNGNPSAAWEMLCTLAEHRGIIRDAKTAGQPWPKVEKRIQEIRKVLREHFRITADPIPFVEGTGYQALFKISRGRSFNT